MNYEHIKSKVHLNMGWTLSHFKQYLLKRDLLLNENLIKSPLCSPFK